MQQFRRQAFEDSTGEFLYTDNVLMNLKSKIVKSRLWLIRVGTVAVMAL